MTILHQAADWLAVDKPRGVFVHPPEDGRGNVPPEETALHRVRDQIGRKLFPVHRLDRPTSGVLIFALTSARAAWFQVQFQSNSIEKYYTTVVRGWIDHMFTCETPLKIYGGGGESNAARDARTTLTPIARTVVPHPLGAFPSARLSMIVAQPHTGRFHQIRRHLAHLGHPVAGDTTHGDLRFNRYIEEHLGWNGLQLRAASLQVPADGSTPDMLSPTFISAPWPDDWQPVLTYFNLSPKCPG